MTNQIPDTTIKKPKFTPGPLTASGNGVHKGTSCVAIAFDPVGGPGVTEVAQANAKLFAAGPALYEALQYVSEVSERQAAKGADDSDTVNITVTVGWLREVKDALSLVDHPITEEGKK